MKILFGESRDEVAEEAQRYLRLQRQAQNKVSEFGKLRPRGVAHHTARYAVTCDECDKTFWANDPYSQHKGCKGSPDKEPLGFDS